jgi:hypothetical protein
MNKVKLIVGMISNKDELFKRVKEELEEILSNQVDYFSSILPFNFTSYYEAELGKGLLRQFISFKNLIYPDELVKIKHKTNNLEDKLRINGKRSINLDPGYLTLNKLVLASRKDASWRVYLGEEVYAEATLRFFGGSFCAFEYTYPDYKTEAYISIFNEIRKIYKSQCKK